MALRLISPDGTQSYDLRDGVPLIVGRAPTCDLPVFDPTISRRHAELVAKGQTVTFEATLEDMKTRDARDEGRAIAPLKRADSAILVDSNAMSIEETVAFMLEHVRTAEQTLQG